jgi:hypothetical protein
VRQRAEDQRAALQVRIVVGNEPHLLTTEPCALAPPLVGAGEVKAKSRVLRDEGTQLTAGIAGRAEHPDGKFMHEE